MYAIVEVKGQQFKVTEGSTITVPHIEEEAKQNIYLEKVLLFSDGSNTELGSPLLSNVTVSATVVNHMKGKKIDVLRYKPKVNHRVKRGHRTESTCLYIDSIRKA